MIEAGSGKIKKFRKTLEKSGIVGFNKLRDINMAMLGGTLGTMEPKGDDYFQRILASKNCRYKTVGKDVIFSEESFFNHIDRQEIFPVDLIAGKLLKGARCKNTSEYNGKEDTWPRRYFFENVPELPGIAYGTFHYYNFTAKEIERYGSRISFNQFYQYRDSNDMTLHLVFKEGEADDFRERLNVIRKGIIIPITQRDHRVSYLKENAQGKFKKKLDQAVAHIYKVEFDPNPGKYKIGAIKIKYFDSYFTVDSVISEFKERIERLR